MLEPGRFRLPRNEREEAHLADQGLVSARYPNSVPARLFMDHTRPEPMLGVLDVDRAILLDEAELAALDAKAIPHGVIID